jgi:hypothetical protein
MLAPRPVGYGLNPSQQEEDGLQFVDVLKQLAGGFVQGFTTIDIVEEEPDNWLESLAQGAGYFAGFVGIIPGVGTALSFGTKAGTMGVRGGIKLLGGVVGREGAEAAVTKTMQGLRTVTNPVVGRYYTQTRSIPMYAADLIMNMGKKALAGTPAEALAKKVLLGPGGKRVVAESVAEGAIRMGLASGVSSWQGGIDQMAYSFATGAAFGGLDRGVAEVFGGQPAAIRALAGMMVNGLPSTLMDQPLEIQVFDYLTGAWFGTEMPYAQRKALEVMTGPSSVTADGKRRYEAWLNPEENIPEYKNAEELYGDQAENVRKEIVHQARMWLGSSLGTARGGITSQIVSHAIFKKEYDVLVAKYEAEGMNAEDANNAALDAIRKGGFGEALVKATEQIDQEIKEGAYDLDPFTGEQDLSGISDRAVGIIKDQVAKTPSNKLTDADILVGGLRTSSDDQPDPVAQRILDVEESVTPEVANEFVVRESEGITLDQLVAISDKPDVDARAQEFFNTDPALEATIARDLGLGREQEEQFIVSTSEREQIKRAYGEYLTENPSRDVEFKQWLDSQKQTPEALLGVDSTPSQKIVRTPVNSTIETGDTNPIPVEALNPNQPVATDVVPLQADPTVPRPTKKALDSTDTATVDDTALFDDNILRNMEDGYTGDINGIQLRRQAPIDYVTRTIVSLDDTIPASQKQARYNEILNGIKNDYDQFGLDNTKTPADFAEVVVNKYISEKSKVSPDEKRKLTAEITQTIRKIKNNEKAIQYVVDPTTREVFQASSTSRSGEPIAVSKAPSHFQRGLNKFNKDIKVYSIRYVDNTVSENSYKTEKIFDPFESPKELLWIHHKMLEQGKAFAGHVKSNGELVYYDMIPVTPEEKVLALKEIQDLGLEQTYLDARQEYIDEVKTILDIDEDSAKDLYDTYVASQVKLHTDVLNPGVKLADLAKKGFVNDFLALNKRMQLLHADGQWADARYFAGIDDAEGGFKYVILNSANKNGLTKREGVEDDIFSYEKNGEVFDEVSETATDGAVIVRQDVFDQMVRDGGYDPEAGVIKSIIAAGDDSDLGMLLSKHAMFRAGNAQDAFLKENGLHMILRDTSAKQSGKRVKYDSQLGNDGKMRIYKAGTQEQVDIKDAIYTMPVEGVSYNLGTKEDIASSLENQVLVSQALGNLHASKVDQEIINEVFDETIGNSFRGDPKEAEKLQRLNVELDGETDQVVAKLKASKIKIEKLGVQDLVDILNPNVSTNIYVYDSVMRQILKSNIKEDPSSYVAESEFLGKNLSAAEKALLSLSDDIEILSPSILSNKNLVGYVDNKVASYLHSRISTPEVPYSAKAIGLPTDEFNRGLVKPGEFMLGQGSRNMKVKSRALEKDMKLGDLFDIYQAEVSKDPQSELVKNLEQDLRMIVIRVPSDSISGARSMMFKGFYDNRGTGIALHSEDMAYMGGMDLDIDSTFIYQDLGKNKYGKAQETLHDVLLRNKDQWTKQVGDKKVNIPSKNEEGARAMGVQPIPTNKKNVASLFDMTALTTAGFNATKGKQAVGFAASARTDISSWWSVAPDVVTIDKNQKGIKLPSNVNKASVIRIESVKKADISEFDGFARQAMNYAADSADSFDMIRPTEISNMLWSKAFDTYAVVRNKDGSERRILIDSVKPKEYKLYKDAIDSTNKHIFTDAGVRKNKSYYEYLISFKEPQGTSDFKSKKALLASSIESPDPDIFALAGLPGLTETKYSKIIDDYKTMYTKYGYEKYKAGGEMTTQDKQRIQILESLGILKSINGSKEVVRLRNSIEQDFNTVNTSTDPAVIDKAKRSIASKVNTAKQLISQDVSDITTASMLYKQVERVMKAAETPERKELVAKAVNDIANKADSFKKDYAVASREINNSQGINKSEVVEGLQLKVKAFRDVLQSKWQRDLFDTYMIGTFNVQNPKDVAAQNKLYEKMLSTGLSVKQQDAYDKLTAKVFNNNLNSFGSFLRSTGLENTNSFYKSYGIVQDAIAGEKMSVLNVKNLYKRVKIEDPQDVYDFSTLGKQEAFNTVPENKVLSEPRNDTFDPKPEQVAQIKKATGKKKEKLIEEVVTSEAKQVAEAYAEADKKTTVSDFLERNLDPNKEIQRTDNKAYLDNLRQIFDPNQKFSAEELVILDDFKELMGYHDAHHAPGWFANNFLSYWRGVTAGHKGYSTNPDQSTLYDLREFMQTHKRGRDYIWNTMTNAKKGQFHWKNFFWFPDTIGKQTQEFDYQLQRTTAYEVDFEKGFTKYYAIKPTSTMSQLHQSASAINDMISGMQDYRVFKTTEDFDIINAVNSQSDGDGAVIFDFAVARRELKAPIGNKQVYQKEYEMSKKVFDERVASKKYTVNVIEDGNVVSKQLTALEIADQIDTKLTSHLNDFYETFVVGNMPEDTIVYLEPELTGKRSIRLIDVEKTYNRIWALTKQTQGPDSKIVGLNNLNQINYQRRLQNIARRLQDNGDSRSLVEIAESLHRINVKRGLEYKPIGFIG